MNYSKLFQWIIISVIILISLVFLFPPNYLIVREYSGYAIHWMLICLIIGIISLFIGNEKILYSSFFASGLIAFFLMNSFNTDLRLASFNNPSSISVLFANLTLSNDDENKTMNTIYLIDADIVLIEELTPDKIKLLQEIRSKYPYQSMLPRVDPLGKAVLSKFKFYEESSFGIFGNPILNLGVINDTNDSFKILVSNSLPPITLNSYQKLNLFLDSLAVKIKLDFPNVLLAANFNLVPWSKELRNFRIQTGLVASRRDNNEGESNSGAFGILNTPNNDIFYSKGLECSRFNVLKDTKDNAFGLYGRYQRRAPL
ncbi:MAG: hypothetical protein WBO31_02850 [Saprospiraceae bacterium]